METIGSVHGSWIDFVAHVKRFIAVRWHTPREPNITLSRSLSWGFLNYLYYFGGSLL